MSSCKWCRRSIKLFIASLILLTICLAVIQEMSRRNSYSYNDGWAALGYIIIGTLTLATTGTFVLFTCSLFAFSNPPLCEDVK